MLERPFQNCTRGLQQLKGRASTRDAKEFLWPRRGRNPLSVVCGTPQRMSSPSPEKQAEPWFCHCCGFQNKGADASRTECRVCGRNESYALDGYPMPLHGKGGSLFRPSQILNVLTNIDETDSVMWTPLHNACVTGNTATAERLLEMGAFIEAATDKGQTPLHLAIYNGSLPTVKALLARGASTNAVTRFELSTPLHYACEGGRREILLALLGAGANPNALNKMERSPLHIAALAGRADMGAALIRDGARIDLKDAHGWNPRQLAELRAHREFAELIVRNESSEARSAVFKEMPPAEWHCKLWDEVVGDTQKAAVLLADEEKKMTKFKADVALARSRLDADRAAEAERKRQVVLAERRRAKALRDAVAEQARQSLIQETVAITGGIGGMALKDFGQGQGGGRERGRGGGRGGGGRPTPPASLLGLDQKQLRALQKEREEKQREREMAMLQR